MTEKLNQSTKSSRLTKTKGIILASMLAGAMALPFFMPTHKMQAENEYFEHNALTGTWIKPNGVGGLTPLLTTFMSDGSLISSRCIIVPTGPASAELVSTGHGQWIRTGHNQFTATTLYIRSGIGSGPSVEFTGLVKTVETISVNRAGDQLARTATLYIYDADNNLLFPPGPPGSTVSIRVIAGQ